MFLYSKKPKVFCSFQTHHFKSSHTLRRKDKLSPLKIQFLSQSTGTFFFASPKRKIRGTLTVEAALVLPMVLFAMIAVLQYGCCMEVSVKMGNALAETGKSMAMASYAMRYGGDLSEVQEVAAGALSVAYARQKVMGKAGDTSCIKNANMVLSSFLQEGDMINLVLTYQMKTPIGIIRLPGSFFIQCGKVRAWTGRSGSGNSGDEQGEHSNQEYVYMTITGTVYHEDPECTHLKLSVRETDRSSLEYLRNNSGGKYHICERCGNFGSSTVYITDEGNRYHSSLSCSGLKRTVRQVHRDEIGHVRSCSKCGNHEEE